jgi:glucokinase
MLSASNDMEDYAIGIDIGGTKTLIAIVNRSGCILGQSIIPTNPNDGSVLYLERLCVETERLITELRIDVNICRGLGVATAGVVDSAAATVKYAANLGWRQVKVGEVLGKYFGLQVKLGNDANLSAVAEYVWGTAKEVKDLIYVTVSTGIGAGIISGGRLVAGADDSAGEFGHISMNVNGPQCGCGNYGCLEMYASGTAIANSAKQLVINDPSITSKEVMEAAETGDDSALQVIRTAGFYLGNGITTLIHLFNPKLIVLGGGVMQTGDILLGEIESIIQERCIEGMKQRVAVRRTALGKEIGALGAAGQFFMSEKTEESS